MKPHSSRSDSEDENCHLLLCYSPPWARRLATHKIFALCYSILSMVQGMLFFYMVGTLTTIESHFQLPSETFGLIISVGEVLCMLSSVVVGLLITNKTHRPYCLGISCLLMGVGNNLFALPYYLYGSPITLDNANNGISTHTLCIENSTNNMECVSALLAPPGSSTWSVGLIFLLAWSIANIGSNAMYIIGTPFLDDNVENKNSPMYLGIMCSIRTIGPIFGSLLSTVCLAVYINPKEPARFDNRDSRWVGAWWLGYLITGWLSIACAFLIAQFPRRLPSHKITPAMQMALKEKKPNEDKIAGNDKNPTVLSSFKEMLPGVRRVLRNFMLWLRVLSGIFTYFGLEGFVLYMPKYLEHEFHITASQASIWTGTAFLLPSMVGEILVGFLVQRFKPTTKQLAGILAVAKITEAIIMAVLPVLQCKNTGLLGSGSETPVCDVAACDCSDAVFSPICGADGQSYYSACHAGCGSLSGPGERTYNETFLSNCSCILNGGFASASICEIECPQKIGYLLLIALSKLCLAIEVVASTLFLLRCVEPCDKTLASALLGTFLGLFTFIPCPIVFSALVDSTCEVWGEQCGRAGACNVYNMDVLRAVLHYIPALLLAVAAFWDGLFWWFSKTKVELFQDETKSQIHSHHSSTTTQLSVCN